MTSENGSKDRPDRFTPFQRLLSSRLVTGLGMWFSRHAPPFLGRAVAWVIATLISTLKPRVYWIVHGNLRHVVSLDVDERGLRRLVRQVFHNNARNIYDLWHAVSRGPEAVREAAVIPPEAWDRIQQALQSGRGVFIAGAHTGNFDLGILSLAARGVDLQVLGLAAAPGGGFDLMDRMRVGAGAHLTSINVQSLREALRRLRAGGVVLTGVDRPVGDEEPTVEFFGQPALLPTGHVRLARRADAVVLVGAAYYDRQQGRTVMRVSPPIEMERTGDREEDFRVNLRRVTEWLETFIRARPDQWAMFLPVWPEDEAQNAGDGD